MANMFLSKLKSAAGAIIQLSKTVTASTTDISVTPDNGYDAMAEVVVHPTPSELQAVTAGTSDIEVTPSSGNLLASVTVHPTPSTAITPSNASPVTLTGGEWYVPSSNGVAISSYSPATPSNSSPVSVSSGSIYKITSNNGVIIQSYRSVTPPSSGYTTLSSGSFCKILNNTGYLYGSVQGGGLTPTTLWTNPTMPSSTSSTFSTQTVTLTSSIENFSYIGVQYATSSAYYGSSDYQITTAIMSISDFKKCTNAAKTPAFFLGIKGSSFYYRRVSYISSSSIDFGGATTGTAADNKACYPLYIIGYN